MPPDRAQLGRNSIEQEGRILLAIQAIQKKEITSIRETTRRFNIPEPASPSTTRDYKPR